MERITNPPQVVSADEWEAARQDLPTGDRVYRTYLTDRRGVEPLSSNWALLDLTPLGRQEEWEDSPEGRPQTAPYGWWRLHDEYGE